MRMLAEKLTTRRFEDPRGLFSSTPSPLGERATAVAVPPCGRQLSRNRYTGRQARHRPDGAGNKAYPAVGLVQSSSPVFNQELQGYSYDPARARQLLREPSYPDGFELEVLATASRLSRCRPSWASFGTSE